MANSEPESSDDEIEQLRRERAMMTDPLGTMADFAARSIAAATGDCVCGRVCAVVCARARQYVRVSSSRMPIRVCAHAYASTACARAITISVRPAVHASVRLSENELAVPAIRTCSKYSSHDAFAVVKSLKKQQRKEEKAAKKAAKVRLNGKESDRRIVRGAKGDGRAG
jgi:hypothetical protein